MGSNSRSDQVVCVTDIGNPISHGLINSILEGTLTIFHRDYLSSESIHTEYVKLLTFAIHGSHVNSTVKTKLGTNGGSSHTVLSSTCLGNDTWLSNTLGKECLSNGIINLMSTGMSQILTLKPNLGTSAIIRQTLSKVKRSGSSNKVLTVDSKFRKEFRIILDLIVLLLNFTECLRQSLGDELSSELTKVSLLETFLADLILGDFSKCSGLILGICSLLQSSTQIGNLDTYSFGTFRGGGILSSSLNSMQNGRPDYNTITEVRNSLHHVRVRNTKSNGKGQISLGTDTGYEIWKIIGEGRTCSRNTCDRNTI
mmetsp:Transcript_18026/g.27360  ORF Transcript_18026/g.27360 Transcript_18026/m.27360 type:complete len:312 (+) Transcript_18026:240-1175(+)